MSDFSDLDVVTFPDPIGHVIGLLSQRFDCPVSAELPDEYSRHILVTATLSEPNMVTRTGTFIIEVRDRTSPVAASQLGSDIASHLAAVCRLNGNPYGWRMNSLVANFPDPDDRCPRSVLTATMSWSADS